jgi:hypothetical protein
MFLELLVGLSDHWQGILRIVTYDIGRLPAFLHFWNTVVHDESGIASIATSAGQKNSVEECHSGKTDTTPI